MVNRRTDAAEDPLARRCIEERVGHGVRDGFFDGDFDAARAMSALYGEAAQIVSGDERAAAGGAIEDEVHANFSAVVMPSR